MRGPLPVVRKAVVWRVGDPQVAGKPAWSMEGLGVSVSEHPAAWTAIAKLKGETWRLTPRRPRRFGVFLDVYALSQDQVVRLTRTAMDKGLLRSERRWKGMWGVEDDHGEIPPLSEGFNYSFFETREKAELEAEVASPDGETWAVREEVVAAPTERLRAIWAERFTGELTDMIAAQVAWQVLLERSRPDLDGFWWNDDLDTDGLSAPRGMIFYSRIAGWTWRRDSMRRNTDEALRAREREARDGDPQARARLIAEQLRAGKLTPERVEVASWVGDPAAQLVIDPPTFVRRYYAGPHAVSSLALLLDGGQGWPRWGDGVPHELWFEFALRAVEKYASTLPPAVLAPGEPSAVAPSELPEGCANGLAALRSLIGEGVTRSTLLRHANRLEEVDTAVFDGELEATTWDHTVIQGVHNLLFSALWLTGWQGESGDPDDTTPAKHGVALALQAAESIERVDDRARLHELREALTALLLDQTAPHVRFRLLSEDPKGRRRRRNVDEDLRSLERAAATGDPQARARLVVARLRAGQRWEVTDEDVEALSRGSSEAEALRTLRDAGLIEGAEGPLTLSGDRIIKAFVGLHLGRGPGFYSSGRQGAVVNSFWVRAASDTKDPESATGGRRPRGALRDLDLARVVGVNGQLWEQIEELTEDRPVVVHRVSYMPRHDERLLGFVVTSPRRRILWIAQAGSGTTERSRATVYAVARTVGWDLPGGWCARCVCGHQPNAHGEELGVCQYCRCDSYRIG